MLWFKRKIRAFSLLENSIALIFVGISINFIIKYWNVVNYEYRVIVSTRKANYIRKSLQGYVARNGFLPYASCDDFGVETNECCVGFLPYRTLGIDSDYLFDGFGKRFKFVVNKNLVLKHVISRKILNKEDSFAFVLPVQLPNRFIYTDRSITWNRLYQFTFKESGSGGYYFFKYDEFNDNFNINLFNKNGKLELDFIGCYHPFKKNYLHVSYDEFFKRLEEYYEKIKICDLVAWSLISERKYSQSNLDIFIDNGNIVYFQTRFNLAAQLKHPVTSIPLFFKQSMLCDYEDVRFFIILN